MAGRQEAGRQVGGRQATGVVDVVVVENAPRELGRLITFSTQLTLRARKHSSLGLNVQALPFVTGGLV